MPTVEQRGAGFGCRIGSIGPIVVSVFDSKPELGLLDLLDKVQNEHIAKYGRISGLTIISMPRLDPPDAEFRARSAEMAKRLQGSMVGTAMVITTTGAAAVIARAFLAAHSLLVQQKSPQATFRLIAPAVKWLQELPGQPPEVRDMVGLTEAAEAFALPKPGT